MIVAKVSQEVLYQMSTAEQALDMRVCLFVLLCGLVAVTQETEQGVMCSFAGSKYPVGETWHPFLHPIGMMNCINCTCLQTGQVKCESPPCPKVTCANPRMTEGACCPKCIDNIPPSNTRIEVPKPVVRQPYRYRTCYHDDQTYQHSQVFTSMTTALKPTMRNQCVLCICLDGDVLCYLKTCADLQCTERVLPEDDCCPSCKEEIEANGVGDSGAHLPFDFLYGNGTIHMVSQKGDSSDCKVGDQVYKVNATWHPVIGPFGPMDCVMCSCVDGRVMCERLRCTPPEVLPCRKPRHVRGRCCQVCPREGKRKNNRKRKNKKKEKHRKNSSHMESKSTAVAKACSVAASEAIAFYSKSRDKTARRVFIYTLVFEMKKKGLDIHQWQLEKGVISNYTSERLPLSRYEDIFQQDNQQYRAIGMLRKRRAVRFGRRVQRQLDKCQPKCRRKHIERLIKGLKVKPLEFQYNLKC